MEGKSLRKTLVSFPQKSSFTIGLTSSDESLSVLRTKSCYNLHRISQPVYSLFPVIMNVWESSRQIGKKNGCPGQKPMISDRSLSSIVCIEAYLQILKDVRVIVHLFSIYNLLNLIHKTASNLLCQPTKRDSTA